MYILFKILWWEEKLDEYKLLIYKKVLKIYNNSISNIFIKYIII